MIHETHFFPIVTKKRLIITQKKKNALLAIQKEIRICYQLLSLTPGLCTQF